MNRSDILLRLRKMRREIEAGQDGLLSEEQTTLLTDVCRALGIVHDSEIYYIVGEAFASFIAAPIAYRLAGATAFAVAFGQQAEAAGDFVVTVVGDKVTLGEAIGQ